MRSSFGRRGRGSSIGKTRVALIAVLVAAAFLLSARLLTASPTTTGPHDQGGSANGAHDDHPGAQSHFPVRDTAVEGGGHGQPVDAGHEHPDHHAGRSDDLIPLPRPTAVKNQWSHEIKNDLTLTPGAFGRRPFSASTDVQLFVIWHGAWPATHKIIEDMATKFIILSATVFDWPDWGDLEHHRAKAGAHRGGHHGGTGHHHADHHDQGMHLQQVTRRGALNETHADASRKKLLGAEKNGGVSERPRRSTVTDAEVNLWRLYSGKGGWHRKTMELKVRQCGRGPFIALVVIDPSPKYQDEKTMHGTDYVNHNMNSAKKLYRSWSGGGFHVHGTFGAAEAAHDVPILFHRPVEHFVRLYQQSEGAAVRGIGGKFLQWLDSLPKQRFTHPTAIHAGGTRSLDAAAPVVDFEATAAGFRHAHNWAGAPAAPLHMAIPFVTTQHTLGFRGWWPTCKDLMLGLSTVPHRLFEKSKSPPGVPPKTPQHPIPNAWDCARWPKEMTIAFEKKDIWAMNALLAGDDYELHSDPPIKRVLKAGPRQLTLWMALAGGVAYPLKD